MATFMLTSHKTQKSESLERKRSESPTMTRLNADKLLAIFSA